MFNRKSSTSKPDQDPSKVVVSAGASHNLSFVIKRRLIQIFVILLLVVGVSYGFFKYGPFSSRSTVLQIDDQKFSKQQINDYLNYPVNVLGQSRKDATNTLVDYLTIKVAADKLGIKITDLEIWVAYQKIHNTGPLSDKWVNLASLVGAIKETGIKLGAGSISGYSYVFYFGNKSVANSTDPKPVGFGDAKQIEADRVYAKQQADKYYAQLKKGAPVAQKLLDQLKADTKLNLNYQPNTSLSTRFGNDPKALWQDQISYADVVNAVKAQKNPGISSSVMIGKVSNTNAYYYFFYLDRTTSIRQSQLDAKVKSLKVTKHGI